MEKDITFSEADLDAALAYSRWLHMEEFTKWQNTYRREFGLPIEKPTICLNSVGKRVYERILKAVIERRRVEGTVLTLEGERRAVVQELHAQRRQSRAQRLSPTNDRADRFGRTEVVKFAPSGQRQVRGYASTSAIDRVGDIVEPQGGQWALPVPLLWNHEHAAPVGWVKKIDLRGDGLWIEAEFAQGVGRADEIWAMVEKGLVPGFSIGFRILKAEPLSTGGLRFTKWELLEVSAVTVPANADARIQRGGEGFVRLIPAAVSSGGAVQLTNGPNLSGIRLRGVTS